MSFSFFYVVTNGKIFLFFMDELCVFFIHSSIDRHLGCTISYLLWIVLNGWRYLFKMRISFPLVIQAEMRLLDCMACACVSRSVVSNSLWPHELQPTEILCSWDSPGKNTGGGCHSFSRGSSRLRDWTQVSHRRISHRQILYHLSHQGSPDCIVVLFLIFWGNCITFSTVAVPGYFPTNRVFFLHILANTHLLSFW